MNSKLSKLTKLFQKKDLAAEVDQMKQDFRVLTRYLSDIFHIDEAELQQTMVILDDKGGHNALIADNLPYHTRDNAWLAKYTAHIVKDAQEDVEFRNVKKFVNTSADFDAFRCAYEQELTKQQIQYMLKGHHNFIMSEKYRTFDLESNPDYDKLFRSGVEDAMRNLGVDARSIEVGLENNAYLWREDTMQKAFHNRYYPKITMPDANASAAEHKRYNLTKVAHEDTWMRVRRYEYYQDHTEILDELNLAVGDMLMTPEEADLLTKENERFHNAHEELLANAANKALDDLVK